MYTELKRIEEKVDKINSLLNELENCAISYQYYEEDDFGISDDIIADIFKLFDLLSDYHLALLSQIAAIKEDNYDNYLYYQEGIDNITRKILFMIYSEGIENEITEEIEDILREEI